MQNFVGESSTQYTPEEVKFGGVLGMFDVADRVNPVKYKDIGRMHWAREVFDATQRFSKALPMTCETQQCSDG